MTLKLRSIHLGNWKCYQNQDIKFNLDTNNRIWIVFGQNGFGKTSLLEAIKWCLYGSDTISPNELLVYFNRVAIKENPELEILVQLIFNRDSDTYNINRTAKRIVRGTTQYAQPEEASFYKNGIEKKDARERIEELLPNSCKDFFFFDGVEIKRYANQMHTEATRKAIERILGIPELRNLRHDAELAMQTLQKKLSDAASNNKLLEQETSSLKDVTEDVEIKKEQLQIVKEEQEAANDILKDTQERAGQIEELRSKLDEIKSKEREYIRLQENLNKVEDEVEAALKKTPIPLMLEFVREVKDDMQSKTITTARRSGFVEQLRELMEVDRCMYCGHRVDESSREYILRELERVENHESQTKDAIQQDNLRDSLAALSRFQTPNFTKLLERRERLDDDIEEVKQAVDRLKEETHGINGEEAEEIWKKVANSERDLKEKTEKIERLNKEIENLENKEDELHREIEKLAGQNKETANLAHQVKLARGLYQAADELITWRIAERKETIETRTSDLHRRVTNKPDEYIGVEIREDYTLGVKNAAGEVLNPDTLSAGEKEALAFAFIAGLNLASGTAAPLIMDTPFGHLDTDHQKNLVSSLPDLPSQVIVLATDRDLPNDLLKSLQPHVAGKLKIKRLGATEDASIVEVDE